MKKVIFIFLFAVAAVGAKAQSFEKGTNVLNIGVGFGSSLTGDGGGRPAISASYERGIWPIGGPGVISLGAYVGNKGYSWSGGNYKLNYNLIGVRAAYHFTGFTKVPKLDVYAGTMISYSMVSYKINGEKMDDFYDDGVDFNLYIGGRWYFGDHIGAFAELGYGVSNANLGIAFKF